MDQATDAAEVRDVFLSYNRADTQAVASIKAWLEARQISTFFDRDQLIAGLPWPQALESGLRQVKSVAVFIGPAGLGLWQKREMAFALDRQVAEEREQRPFPVIPVLLPGADITPGFLFLNTWVDFRADLSDEDTLNALLNACRGRSVTTTEDYAANLCPYQGLRNFREESAAFFCGREAFSQRIKDILLQKNLVVVIGPSGSGKSSLIQAGVMPLLRRERPPAATWDALVFVPGANPINHLAAALAPLLPQDTEDSNLLAATSEISKQLRAGDTQLTDLVGDILAKSSGTDRLLLVVDQFEEVFTLCRPEERRVFLNLLFKPQLGPAPCTVLITMRGTFYEALITANRQISDFLESAIVNLGPMTREELNKAITEPAKRVGLKLEAGLAKRILDDVGDEPGNLPLLEFALTELWARREGKLLTHAAYEKIGGVAGAIVGRAEAVFTSFTPLMQKTAKEVLLRLVWVGNASENSLEARARVSFDELSEEAQQPIKILADARLLVIGQDSLAGTHSVEVAHEALIRRWPRMRAWLDENREFLLWMRRLQAARETWQTNGQDKASLLRGNPLLEAESWAIQSPAFISAEDAEFIQASSKAAQDTALYRQRRRQVFLVTLWLLIALFMALTSVAVYQSLTAVSEEIAATARSYLKVDPEESLLMGIEAVKVQPTNAAVDVLKLSLQNSLLVTEVDKLDFLTSVAFSPKSNLLVATGKDHKPRIWDWDQHRLKHMRGTIKLPEALNGLALNSGWSKVIAAAPNNEVSVYDVLSGRKLGQLTGHKGTVVRAAFSPDDSCIVTASEDGTARIWDEKSFASLLELKGHSDRLTDAAFNPSGTIVVTSSLDGTATLWDAKTGAKLFTLQGHQASVNTARFSPDGKLIVTASGDNSALVWDAQTGKSVAHLEGHSDSLTFASFSPVDSGLVLTISRDRTGKVWKRPSNARWDWQYINELRGHQDILTAASFSPDGEYIATTSRDRSIRVWKSLNEHARTALYGHTGSLRDVSFTPDGLQVVSASSDNTARVWDLNNKEDSQILLGHRDSLCCVEISPNGGLIATGGDDHKAIIWEAATNKLLFNLEGHEDGLNSVHFDRKGSRLVTASDDNTARIWDATTGAMLHLLGGNPRKSTSKIQATLWDLMISPDGEHVANLDPEGNIAVRAVNTGATVTNIPMRQGPFSAIDFSDDGSKMLTANDKGWVQMWQSKTYKLLYEFKAHDGLVALVAFSSDGHWFASDSTDQTLKIWQVSDGKAYGSPIDIDASLLSLEFSPDGKSITAIDADGVINHWNLQDGKLQSSLCPNCNLRAGHSKRVTSARFSPNGKEVLTASRDGKAIIWDTETGEPLAQIDHQAPLVGAFYSPKGDLIVTLGRDGLAMLWHREGQFFRYKASLVGHGDELIAGEFSADGKRIATSSRDGTARIWSAETGGILQVLKGHEDWVNSVRFSPFSYEVVTASEDSKAVVWNENGGIRMELRGHSEGLSSARFNRDGSQVVTASRDGTLRVWPLKEIEENKICPECSASLDEICKQARSRAQRPLNEGEREKFHIPFFSPYLDFRCR